MVSWFNKLTVRVEQKFVDCQSALQQLIMKKQILLLAFILMAAQTWAQTERMTAETLWALGRVSLYDVTPDGKTVLFGVTTYDVPENKMCPKQ